MHHFGLKILLGISERRIIRTYIDNHTSTCSSCWWWRTESDHGKLVLFIVSPVKI